MLVSGMWMVFVPPAGSLVQKSDLRLWQKLRFWDRCFISTSKPRISRECKAGLIWFWLILTTWEGKGSWAWRNSATAHLLPLFVHMWTSRTWKTVQIVNIFVKHICSTQVVKIYIFLYCQKFSILHLKAKLIHV